MKHLRTDNEGFAYLEDDKWKVVGKDLFGKDIIVRMQKTEATKERPSIIVSTKLRKDEYQKLEELAKKFGITKFKYIRDALLNQLKEHEILLQP